MSGAAASEATGGVHERPRRPSARARVLVVGALLIAAFAIALTGRLLQPKKALPVMGHIPAFALTDQANRPFSPSSMTGHVWVADFIFTHCQSSCPRLTARMAELQKALVAEGARKGGALNVRLVSFSVDPENDTPALLADYAERTKADPALWSFATGPTEDVQKIVQQGFKISAVKVEKGAGDFDVIHGNWFILGDPDGNIRGYYSTETDADMKVLVEDVLRLEAEWARR